MQNAFRTSKYSPFLSFRCDCSSHYSMVVFRLYNSKFSSKIFIKNLVVIKRNIVKKYCKIVFFYYYHYIVRYLAYLLDIDWIFQRKEGQKESPVACNAWGRVFQDSIHNSPFSLRQRAQYFGGAFEPLWWGLYFVDSKNIR